ncbi:MAG: hypothetical protein ACJAXY_001716 [Nonlabens sp.]|jgi:hypothetical protein
MGWRMNYVIQGMRILISEKKPKSLLFADQAVHLDNDHK